MFKIIPVPDLKATNSFSRISDSGDLLRISSRLIQIWYKVRITGTVSDSHPQKWIIEFAKNIDAADWKQIHLEEDASKPVDFLWSSGEVGGKVGIRLTALDEADNSASDTVDVQLDNLSPIALATIEALPPVVGGEVTIRIQPKAANLKKSYDLEWGAGEVPTTWNNLNVSNFVAKWNTNTQQTPDNTYTLRITAFDTADLKWIDEVQTLVDNTEPAAKISSPRPNNQVGGNIEIRGVATDVNFKSYTLEFGEGPSPAVWTRVEPTDRGVAVDTEGELMKWAPGKDRLGTFTLRLTVTDMVDHLATTRVTVDVLEGMAKEKGGTAQSRDRLVTLYLSPRAFSEKTVITINPLPEAEVAAVPAAPGATILGLAYELGPPDLKLTQHKPATLSIRYDRLNYTAAPDRRLGMAHLKHPSPSRGGAGGGGWKPIGGTVNAEEKTVTTAVTELGRYALVETDAPSLESSAVIADLTCQPRIFSPNGSGFNTETTISFKLSAPVTVECIIYNLAGELVCRLIEGEPMSGGVNTIRWNGNDADGRQVFSSMYVVCIQAGDQQAFQTVGVVNR